MTSLTLVASLSPSAPLTSGAYSDCRDIINGEQLTRKTIERSLDWKLAARHQRFTNLHMASPRITSIEWGVITFDTLPTGKDYKLWPGGGRAWDWGETGTRHKPGIQPADVQELLDNGAEEIVLSRGMQSVLCVSDETKQWVEKQDGVKNVHVAETKEAVEIYDRLVGEGVKVGGLFHSTC